VTRRLEPIHHRRAADDRPHHASRITHHASRITHHASRITHHASRITYVTMSKNCRRPSSVKGFCPDRWRLSASTQMGQLTRDIILFPKREVVAGSIGFHFLESKFKFA
jgi:hypothetical protein